MATKNQHTDNLFQGRLIQLQTFFIFRITGRLKAQQIRITYSQDKHGN